MWNPGKEMLFQEYAAWFPHVIKVQDTPLKKYFGVLMKK